MTSATEGNNHEDMENVRIGYQVAVNFATFHAENVWSIFNAMLVANTIVATGSSLVTNGGALAAFKVLLPIVGLTLCAAWFLLVNRAHAKAIYYTLSARELEEQFLSHRVRIISRGGDFSDGSEVSLKIGEKQTVRQMPRWVRHIRGEWITYGVIVVFMAIYVSMFFPRQP
jgi:hypothetical protein